MLIKEVNIAATIFHSRIKWRLQSGLNSCFYNPSAKPIKLIILKTSLPFLPNRFILFQAENKNVRCSEACSLSPENCVLYSVLEISLVRGSCANIASFLKRSHQQHNTPPFLTRSAQLPHPGRVSCSDLFPHE